MNKFNIEQRGYYPYKDLLEFRDSESFKEKFLEYFKEYRDYIDKIKVDNPNASYIEIHAMDVVRLRNDEEIERIFKKYRVSASKRNRVANEKAIVKLKKDIKLIKDIIMATETVSMKRLQRIDRDMGNLIDSVSFSLGITEDNRSENAKISELLESYAKLDADSFKSATSVLKAISKDICNYYRKNFSTKTATKYIKNLNSRIDKLIDDRATQLGIVEADEKLIDELVERYNSKKIISLSFENYLTLFKNEIQNLRDDFTEKYSDRLAKKLIKTLDKKTGLIIDRMARIVGYPSVHKQQLMEIFSSYDIEKLDLFDIGLYSNEEERDKALENYQKMSDEEKSLFEAKMREQYIRMFKGKIRSFNREIRRVYSVDYANDMVIYVNKKADDLIKTSGKNSELKRWSSLDTLSKGKHIKKKVRKKEEV